MIKKIKQWWKQIWCLHIYEPSYTEKLSDKIVIGYSCRRCIYCDKIKI